VQIAILARLLMPEDFGLMALATLVIGFAQAYADMGLSSAIVQRRDATNEQLSSLFWLNVVVGAGFFGVLLLVAPLFAALYSEPRLTGLISLAALTFLVAPVGQQLFMLLQKNLHFRMLAVIDVVSAVVGVSTAVVLALKGMGVYSLVWGQLAGAVTRSLVLLRYGMQGWRPQFRLRRNDLAGYVRFGAYQMGERTINFLGFNLDKLLIGSLIGTHGLGLYNVAYQLVMKPLQVFNPIIARIAFPLFAMVQNDDARLRSGYLDVIRVVALVLFPIYMGMIVLAEPLVLVLLGEDWRSVVPTLRTLGALGFFYCLGNPIGTLLLAKGRVEIGFYLNIWMIILYGAAIFLGSKWGVQGVALGLVLATALGLFPIGFWVRWLLVGMRPMEYLAAFGPMLVSAVFMGAFVQWARNTGVGFGYPVMDLIALAVIGAAVYFAIIVPWQRPFLVRLKNTRR
jgi:O-antigen/teichoic acid export membrane protein